MRREDLKDDQRFKTLPERSKHRTIIDEIVESWTKNISLRDAEQLMTSVDFPVAPVRHLESILTDPQVKERQMIVKLPHPILNEVITPGSCLKLSKTPGKVESAGYPVGYHTEEILKSLLGYEDDYIKALREKGVIV
jgi:formyl-CoA transferase